jgi:hypothetical protein
MNLSKWVGFGVSAAAVSLLIGATAHADPLRRELASYFILAQRSLSGKNLRVTGSCNVGVNCAQPHGDDRCGVAHFQAPFLGDGSQLAADETTFNRSGGSVFELFHNLGSLERVEVRQPPVEPLALPIIPGTCDTDCNPNVAALETACGFPAPFPPCNHGNPVDVKQGESLALPPGTYGDVRVRDGATLTLGGGAYDVCSLAVAKHAVVTGGGTVINVDGGTFNVGDESTFGVACGEFDVHVRGASRVSFGRNVDVAAEVCAPESVIALGQGNRLLGRFVGDEVNMDRNNIGGCCGGPCACIDEFSPASAHVGASVTLKSHCDLTHVTGVRICGIPAPITARSTSTMTVTVPPGASGSCTIGVGSMPGVFLATVPLLVM